MGGSISGKLPVAGVNGIWVVVAGDSDCGEADVCAGVICGAMFGATCVGLETDGTLEDAESAVLDLGRVVCALPALRDKTYWHFLPRFAHRAHEGFSLPHFNFEVAQWWQLSRSLRGVWLPGERAGSDSGDGAVHFMALERAWLTIENIGLLVPVWYGQQRAGLFQRTRAPRPSGRYTPVTETLSSCPGFSSFSASNSVSHEPKRGSSHPQGEPESLDQNLAHSQDFMALQ